MCHEQNDKKCVFLDTTIELDNSKRFAAITDMMRENCKAIVQAEKSKLKEFEKEVQNRVFNFESS